VEYDYSDTWRKPTPFPANLSKEQEKVPELHGQHHDLEFCPQGLLVEAGRPRVPWATPSERLLGTPLGPSADQVKVRSFDRLRVYLVNLSPFPPAA